MRYIVRQVFQLANGQMTCADIKAADTKGEAEEAAKKHAEWLQSLPPVVNAALQQMGIGEVGVMIAAIPAVGAERRISVASPAALSQLLQGPGGPARK